MKQYLFSVHMDETKTPTSEEVMQQMYNAVDASNQPVQAEGAWIFAGCLFPADTATTVRFRDGDVHTTDGPYAETKERLGGFWVLKAPDLDAALALAKRASLACQGDVEVRPFQDDAEE